MASGLLDTNGNSKHLELWLHHQHSHPRTLPWNDYWLLLTHFDQPGVKVDLMFSMMPSLFQEFLIAKAAGPCQHCRQCYVDMASNRTWERVKIYFNQYMNSTNATMSQKPYWATGTTLGVQGSNVLIYKPCTGRPAMLDSLSIFGNVHVNIYKKQLQLYKSVEKLSKSIPPIKIVWHHLHHIPRSRSSSCGGCGGRQAAADLIKCLASVWSRKLGPCRTERQQLTQPGGNLRWFGWIQNPWNSSAGHLEFMLFQLIVESYPLSIIKSRWQ